MTTGTGAATFEGFLGALERHDEATLHWNGDPTTARILALAARTRLEAPVRRQARRPRGFVVAASEAWIERWRGASRIEDRTQARRTIFAIDLGDLRIELAERERHLGRPDGQPIDPFDAMGEGGDRFWDLHVLGTIAPPGGAAATGAGVERVKPPGSALAMLGGQAGHAAFKAFIEAMAIVATPAIEATERRNRMVGPIGDRTVGRVDTLLVVAETSRHVAFHGVSRPITHGDGEIETFESALSKTQGSPSHALAIQWAIARTRPVVDAEQRPWVPVGKEPDAIVARAAIPEVPGSATLRAAFEIERRRAVAAATGYLRSIGAPEEVVSGIDAPTISEAP